MGKNKKEIIDSLDSIKLHLLHPAKGSNRRKKRLGRGYGSGSGLYCSRGVKGQRARSGSTRMIGFEGGQTPIIRRVPKRGFSSPFKVRFNIVNFLYLEKCFSDGDIVSKETLENKNIIKSNGYLLKILSHGKLTKSLKIFTDVISVTAKQAILNLSGTVEII